MAIVVNSGAGAVVEQGGGFIGSGGFTGDGSFTDQISVAGSNTIGIVIVGGQYGGFSDPNNGVIEWGTGNPMTKLAPWIDQGGGQDQMIYYILNPPAGPTTINWAGFGAVAFGAVAFSASGVDQTTPFGTPAREDTDGVESLAVNSNAGEVVIASHNNYNQSVVSLTSPGVKIGQAFYSYQYYPMGITVGYTAGASATATITFGGELGSLGIYGVSLKPASGGAAFMPKPFPMPKQAVNRASNY